MEFKEVLIDTTIIIDYLRKENKQNSLLIDIYDKYDKVCISSITVFEVLTGLNEKNKNATIQLLKGFKIISFSHLIAQKSASIFRELKKQNQLIEIRDLFIAATASVKQIPVVTLNKKHFNRVSNLIVL